MSRAGARRPAGLQNPKAPLRLLPLILIAIGAVAFLIPFVRLLPYTSDDAFISLRYARHLSQGHGLVYNLGERVEGYTNFLWTVILSVPFLLRVQPVLFMKCAIGILAMGSAMVAYRLGHAMIGAAAKRPPSPDPDSAAAALSPGAAPRSNRGRSEVRKSVPGGGGGDSRPVELLASVPAILFLATPTVILNAADGLETMLFVFLLLLSTYWFLREADDATVPPSAIGLALLAMTRPDGVAFAPWFLGAAMVLRRSRAYLLRFAVGFTAVFGLYWVGRWTYYGDLLPNTFYAKGGGGLELLSRGWNRLLSFLVACGGWAWLAGVPAIVAGRTRRAAILVVGIILIRLGFQVWSGGPWQGHDRFMIPVLPFVYVLIVAGLVVAIRNARIRWAAVAISSAALLVPGWITYPGNERLSLAYLASIERAHVPLGMAIYEGTAGDAVIAMDDAGIGPFLANRTNIDMLGLNDRHIAHLEGRFIEKYDVSYVLSRRPDLVVLIGRTHDPRGADDFRLVGHAALFADARFQSSYQLRRVYRSGPRYFLLVYRRVDSVAVPARF